jgi:hypothetical protein
VLKVWAASAPWARELKYLAPEVIRRVNASVGREVVTELKVSLRPAPGPRAGSRAVPKGGNRRVSGRGSGRSEESENIAPSPVRRLMAAPVLPAKEVAEVEAMVAGIADEKLAAATKRAVLAAKTRPRPSREGT